MPFLFGMLRVLVAACAIVLLLCSAVTLWVRALPLSNLPALVVAVASPYAPFLALSGLMLTALTRRFVLSIIAVVVVAVTLAVQVRWLYFGHDADVGQHVDIRLISSNLRRGSADAAFLVGLARDNADVVTVSELTPEELRRFSQAGIDEEFPYSVLVAAPGAAGMGLWSRFPLAAVSPASLRDQNIVAARLQVPGVRFDPLIASVHIISPVAYDEDGFAQWQTDIVSTKTQLTDFANDAGPAAVIVGGDFNSTPDMRQFRDLLTDGYRDSVEQTGAGFAPTFPSDSWYTPLIVIDHVLTRNAATSSIRTAFIPGSDHRALVATIEVPVDPTTSEAATS